MSDCVFCKIVSGELPCKKIAELEHGMLIEAKDKIAPLHFLSISKEHFGCLDDMYDRAKSSPMVMQDMLTLIDNYVYANNITEKGYRIVINTGDDAGQTVPHFHIHLIGGAKLKNDFGEEK